MIDPFLAADGAPDEEEEAEMAADMDDEVDAWVDWEDDDAFYEEAEDTYHGDEDEYDFDE